MITSKLGTKGRTTVPKSVRAALCVQAGDELLYLIEGQRAILTNAKRGGNARDPFPVFREWSSVADSKGYGKL